MLHKKMKVILEPACKWLFRRVFVVEFDMQNILELLKKLLLVLGIPLAFVCGIYLWSLTMPAVKSITLESRSDPAASYAEAQTRFSTLLEADKARGDIDPKCLPVLLTHGHKTTRAIVLLHGLTACPYQYYELGKLFFEQGYNVYIPRLPRHGLADRMSNVLTDLSAEELLGAMYPALDLADGLGEQVSVAGFSMGGDLTAEAGQLRPDLRLAAPISPAFGIRFLPDFLSPTLARLLLGLPDVYIWWDPINQARIMGQSGYPGYSSHALGQVLRLGLSVRDRAYIKPPAVRDLLMITNSGDMAINLEATDGLADDWGRQGGQAQSFRFPLLPWLPHDFIASDSPGQRTDVSYPKLVELISAYH